MSWWRSPEREARVLTDYARLVRLIAGELQRRVRACDYEDLVQAGMLGLLDAVRRYDPTRGVPFGAYARYRVRGSMLDSIRSYLVPEELGEDALPVDADGEVLGPVDTDTQEEKYYRRERDEHLRQAMEQLPPRWREVIWGYYGESKTLREIGEGLGVNESRACQIRRAAVERLRLLLREMGAV